MALQTNTLYYGDNLPVLRGHIPDECIDLIYLDPPFNSKKSYNVLFKETATLSDSAAQIEAFEDTWHWSESAQAAFEEIALHGSDDTAKLLNAMVEALGHNDVTAYLAMMSVRLVELRRVLKPTGSIYLHCDPTASHYLKVLMDSIFGAQMFKNEIVWKRTFAHSGAHRLGPIHDTLLFYSKSRDLVWNAAPTPYTEKYIETFFRYEDEDGRRYRATILTGSGVRKGESGRPWRGVDPTAGGRHWAIPGFLRPLLGEPEPKSMQEALDRLDEMGRILWPAKGHGTPTLKQYLDDLGGVVLQDVWTDIPPISSQAQERLGYPTQKPLALLERILTASSNEGDVVLDPFCGCGTAVHAAQKLGRRWIGIDITHLAINLIKRRMEDAFPGIKIKVEGEPADLPGAQDLAAHDAYQFQWWALSKVDAIPAGGDRKKGADRGIDGIIPFIEGTTDRKRVIVSVKSGNVNPAFVRDLKGVLEREQEPIGVLITLKPPTKEMKVEAVAAGSWHSERWKKDYPRIQILTIADIFNGKTVQMPPARTDAFAKAPRERADGKQPALGL